MYFSTLISNVQSVFAALNSIVTAFPVELIVLAMACFGTFLLIGTYKMFKDW